MSPSSSTPSFLEPHDTFVRRHIGPDATEVATMLASVGAPSLDALVEETVPADILLDRPLELGGRFDAEHKLAGSGAERGEHELVRELARTAAKNRVLRSFIGMGYHGTIVPAVIQRNVLENPGWYTQYTPYQAEISQGRLEALLNFQTVVADLAGLPLAGASLLDEATAAAEAMAMSHRIARGKRHVFLVSEACHPQTLAVVRTRALGLGIDVEVGDHATFEFGGDVFGVLLQYPASEGAVLDYGPTVAAAHAGGALVTVAADLLALTLLRPPGEFGADIAVGSTQRFGVPMGFGGPHAAYMATTEAYKRQMPGRLIGVSKDVRGRPALRMAMQTREQHIRREKATSNICTAQVLLAVMAGMYAVYHGPDGLRAIAEKVHGVTLTLRAGLERLGFACTTGEVFDTLVVQVPDASAVHERAVAAGVNLRRLSGRRVGVSLDETVEAADLETLWRVVAGTSELEAAELGAGIQPGYTGVHARASAYLEHEVFHVHRAEHELLRYLRRLEGRDLSLTTSMIPLGSCTMKLNGTSEMLPITWPEFGALHPFVPADQAEGYRELLDSLERSLAEITGFAAVSLQPNAGSQGEYAGLLAIRGFHRAGGHGERNVCLIPTSAHGTNPASAILAGMRVVIVKCDELGNIDVGDLRARAEEHRDGLAALMVTYPSTHGVFEERIREICAIVHEFGGQVYLDGANMNAQVGLCRPGDYGADVCHLNLHKTFCIPHGGGGPGMGPIGVAEHLVPFLPSHPLEELAPGSVGAVSAAPHGSPSILPISWVYIELMGAAGLKRATQVAILAANYMAKRLGEEFEILYTNAKGRVAHEFILDLRPLEKSAGVTAEDVAKRLMDYGFHAPTVSFPVVGTMMIEPTESETQAELDRLCEALLSIRAEIRAIENGTADRVDNPLKNAPHTAAEVTADEWSHAYTRETAAFPTRRTRESKFWPAVARIDNGYGDKNLICTCPPPEAYAEEGGVLQEA